LIAGILIFAGCKKNEPSPIGGAAGFGGTFPSFAGAGGTGVGGVSATAGSGAAGSATAGSGTAGSAGANAPVPGCEAADPTVTGSAAHAGALEILNQTTPCGFANACHAGSGKAMLTLFSVTDLRALLVDKPSCEAPTFPRVDSHGGNAALAHSWLWQKLTAPDDRNTDALIVQAAWGTPGACGQASGFGDRMPMGGVDTLDEQRLSKIRNWICAGAPGP
jgi:hypothetical protein